MAKIMLVEDDNNLREIYEARLAAEGYDIVSARDGEEALTVAMKEKPDLIISDVMMPKISGFDMLDILRTTEETKNAKVIMMTALSQAEDKERAEKLGADRYLVKSQVTLEDVAQVARDVLDGKSEEATPAPAAVEAPAETSDSSSENEATDESSDEGTPIVTAAPATPTPDPVTPTPNPAPVPEPTATPAEPAATTPAPDPTPVPAPEPAQTTPAADPVAQSAQTEEQVIAQQIKDSLNIGKSAEEPAQTTLAAAQTPEETPASEAPVPVTPPAGKKTIEPINDLNAPGPDLNAMAAKEEAAAQADQAVPQPATNEVISPNQTTPTPPPEPETPPAPGTSVDPNSIAL